MNPSHRGFLRSIAVVGIGAALEWTSTTAHARQTPAFRSPAFEAGSLPQGVAADDFDQDGDVDLAVACESGSGVVLMLGDGAGRLSVSSSTPVGAGTTRIVAGFVNGDSLPDAVVIDPSGAATALLSNGTGGFLAQPPIPLNGVPSDLALGEFTGDSHLDLAITTKAGTSNVLVLRGDGTGGFVLHSSTTVPSTAIAFDVADLDGDADLDLLVASQEAVAITRLMNGGAGIFTAGLAFSPANIPVDVAARDIDGDAKVDAVVCQAGQGKVEVFKGDGIGGFTPTGAYAFAIIDFLAFIAAGMTLADATGDGALDAIVTGEFSGVFLLRGNGHGGFQQPWQTLWVAQSSHGIAVADFDEDGLPDIAASSFSTGHAVLGLADGIGSFGSSTLSPPGQPVDVAVIDATGEGNPDLVIAQVNPTQVSVWNGNGLGQFGPFTNIPLSTIPSRALPGDLDGDSIPDLVLLGKTANALGIAKGLGGGAFAPPQVGAFLVYQHEFGEAELCDLDADGDLDLAALGETSTGMPVISVQLGDGTGSFGPQILPIFSNPASVPEIEVEDLNQDGRVDVVTATETAFNVRLSGPGGSILSSFWYGTPDEIFGLAIADLDGDSTPDVCVSTQKLTTLVSTLRLFHGDGAGGFAQTSTTPQPPGPMVKRVQTGDLDADGDDDLALWIGNIYSTPILRTRGNDGSGGFLPPADYAIVSSVREPVIADLDLDGRLDVASYGAGPSVLLGQRPAAPCPGNVVDLFPGCPGSGGFTPHVEFVGCPTPGATAKLALSQGLGGTTALLFFGAAPAQIPMGGGCILLGFPLAPIVIAVPLSGIGPGNGSIVIGGQIPPGSSPQSAVVQFFTIDNGVPRGFAGSDAVFVTMQ